MKEFTQEQFEEDYEQKKVALESVLGKMHNIVGHAIIPYEVGGAVDMYYFPDHISGTGFATMELLDPVGNGPLPGDFGTYELVAFTKYAFNSRDKRPSPFNLIERRICGIFTTIGRFSLEAVLEPLETCEIPWNNDSSKYVVFDNYRPEGTQFRIGERMHHLLLCLEVFKDEMDFARREGSGALIQLLKDEGYYPYSDLDRPSVIR